MEGCGYFEMTEAIRYTKQNEGGIKMVKRQKRIWVTLFGGFVLLMAGNISSSYAQGSTVDFAGTWNTVTGKGKKIVITMQSVRRTSVTGNYARNGLTASYKPLDDAGTAFVKVSAISGEPAPQSISSINGTVTDNVLRFKWLEDGGRGTGRFTMSSDGQSFEGTFSRTDNPDDTSGGTWNGTRAPNFHGVWRGKSGEQMVYPELLLQQSGMRVVGRLWANRPDMVIKHGVIDGNTLRFTVWLQRSPVPNRYLPDVPAGAGELVMNPDGKSFKGNILGAAVSGIRIAR